MRGQPGMTGARRRSKPDEPPGTGCSSTAAYGSSTKCHRTSGRARAATSRPCRAFSATPSPSHLGWSGVVA
eukprot:6925016-Alexandrium_andersonii.AAC.1